MSLAPFQVCRPVLARLPFEENAQQPGRVVPGPAYGRAERVAQRRVQSSRPAVPPGAAGQL